MDVTDHLTSQIVTDRQAGECIHMPTCYVGDGMLT
jgi:hypothetical protein